MPTVVELLVDELLHPFYIFQIVSVTIWVLQFYFIYASCIFVLATAALIFSVIQVMQKRKLFGCFVAPEIVFFNRLFLFRRRVETIKLFTPWQITAAE